MSHTLLRGSTLRDGRIQTVLSHIDVAMSIAAVRLDAGLAALFLAVRNVP